MLARALAWQGVLSQVLGQIELADRCLERALALVDDPALSDQGELRAFVLLSVVQRVVNTDLDRAKRLAECSVVLYRALGDRWGMASSCVWLGWVIRDLGDYDKAREWLEEGLVLFRESGDRRGIAMSLSWLGLLAVVRGQLEVGERLAREATVTARDLDDHLLARIAVWASCQASSARGSGSDSSLEGRTWSRKRLAGPLLAWVRGMRA